ncbi:heme peroxidase [Tricladium varicosporioides]|nr:heme peroxidase [Hymenoscyphus varicosporioides]
MKARFIVLILLSCFIKQVYADVESITINYQTGYVDGVPLPGDLASLIFTTEIGRTIAQILELNISAQASSVNTIAPEDTTHPCQKWAQISIVLTALFKSNNTGECNDYARSAIRAGFHDAGTWSSTLAAVGQDYGGADGSIYLFGEMNRPENSGLEAVVNTLGRLAKTSGVGVADMIQFAAAHAVVTCPLGPRMRTFIGRKEATQAAPDGLLPSATSDAETLLRLFFDKNIGPTDLTALVGAHSVSKQFSFNTTRAGESQDSTPGVWDTKFYEDTIRSDFSTGSGILTFPSDKALSLYGPLQAEWNGYVVRQEDWIEHFSRAYIRLSLAGVNQIQGMIECTDALPLPVISFP